MSHDSATATQPSGLGNGVVLGFDSPSDFAEADASSSERTTASSNALGQRLDRPALAAELVRTLTEVKGQSQFLLYLADQIEESLGQLAIEEEESQAAFLCKILTMYASQLESKHRCVGEKIGQTCSRVHSTVREYEGG